MTTTQIYVLNLALLPNDKHMAVTAFMGNALTKYSIADTVVGRFVPPYLAAYERENMAFMRIDRKGLTKKVNEADTERINCLRIIRDSLKLFMIMNDEQKKAAAEEIYDAIQLYGGGEIYTQPIDSRTGNITNIVEDLEDKLDDAVAVLDIEAAVESLKTANELFLQYQSDRDEADADYGKSTMAAARVETDKIWRAVVEEVNNTIAYGTAEERAALVPFARYMNVEIDKYRIQNGQGVGGSSSSGTNRPTEGDGDITEAPVVMKNATFRKIDGTAVVIPFAVGAPIEYPANTIGYKWKPELEFMPKTNKTFTEVPIEAKEVTATFHFFDHREVEVKGRVGTALAAPQNTEGYVWEPSVPATMPEEDTSYYEMPIEDERVFIPVTFKYQNNTTVEREYYVGQRVTEADAPEPAEGMAWKYLPFTMPEVEGIVITDCPEYDVEDYRKITIRWKDSAAGINVEQEYSIGEIVEAPEPPAGKHWDTDIIGKPAVPMRVTNIFAVAD